MWTYLNNSQTSHLPSMLRPWCGWSCGCAPIYEGIIHRRDDWINLTRLVYAVLRCTLQRSLVLQCTCDDGVETIRCWNWNLYTLCLNLRSSTCHNNLTIRVNLVLPLICWSIIFAFGPRGPPSRTCIIERWMSLPLTFYALKFGKVHECELTSIIHKQATWPRCYAHGVGEAAAMHQFMKE